MVIAPAKTGRERRSKIAVTRTDQAKRGICSLNIPQVRRFTRVLIKLTAPSKEEIPAKWREKIAKSTEAPLWARLALRGG